MEWTDPTLLIARLGFTSYNNRNWIQKYWTHAKAWLDVGSTQIVVTGHTGVGKTVLAHQLHGKARELTYELPPESMKVETLAIDLGRWSKLFRVLPGQTGTRTQGEIEAFQNNNSLQGVLHLVDFGYVIPRDPVIARSLITDGIDTIEKLRAHNLKTELNDLRQMLTDVRRLWTKVKRPKWVAVVVNKFDLFTNEYDNALNYYHPDGDGAFGRTISLFQKTIGSANVAFYTIPVAASDTEFSWNGARIATGLTQEQQKHKINDLLKSIALISEAHS